MLIRYPSRACALLTAEDAGALVWVRSGLHVWQKPPFQLDDLRQQG